MEWRFIRFFPNLQHIDDCSIISPPSTRYNCIAFAAGDTDHWWWPVDSGLADYYWPPGVGKAETVAAFVGAFESLGYRRCKDRTLEPGCVKVALYATDEGPQHAARQVIEGQHRGQWMSKLGRLEDVPHQLEDLEGSPYGSVICILKKPLSNSVNRGENWTQGVQTASPKSG